jgi:4-hydroxy-tetrahydrodipicolinate synthase
MNYTKIEAKEYARENMKGVWVAITNPFTDDGDLDEKGLKRNLNYYSEDLKINGIFCNGIMGEFWTLTIPERKKILEIIIERSKGRMLISVLTTHHSIRETIELTQHAQEIGADFAVLTNPYIGPKSELDIYSYYLTVCKSVNIGIVVFNTPTNGYSMSPSLIEKLSEIENICAIKTTDAMDHTAEVRRKVGNRIVVSDPLEERLFFNMVYFGQQVFYADPEPYLYQTKFKQPIREYIELIKKDKVKNALEIFNELNPIRKVYMKWIMGPLQKGRMTNAYLKYWTELLGMASGPVRPPLSQVTHEQKEELRQDLINVGLIN